MYNIVEALVFRALMFSRKDYPQGLQELEDDREGSAAATASSFDVLAVESGGSLALLDCVQRTGSAELFCAEGWGKNAI